jgi:hypothetical protein
MFNRAVTAAAWCISEQGRVRAVVFGGLMLFGLVAGLVQPELALAGSGSGGSHGS